jgi:sugar fermentation stimulation protein A
MANGIGDKGGGITWPPLVRGILLKRYKRFLADVRMDGGGVVTAHCPNTGSMRECSESERPVFLSQHDDPKRKYPYTWQLIQMPASLVGVNTLLPNRLVAGAIKAECIPELGGYSEIHREVTVGRRSRIDLRLSQQGRRPCYVEIKNCTLVENTIASFPDAVTQRGRKHINRLRELTAAGNRCVMFYLVQRMDATVFQPADSIDPLYGVALRRASQAGMEILVYDVTLDLKRIRLRRPLPVRL